MSAKQQHENSMNAFLFTSMMLTSLVCVANEAVLPPILPWQGASESLLNDVPAEWITPAEQRQFSSTPNYDETLQYLRRLERLSPLIQLQEFGRSAQGRPLILVIASQNPEPLLNKRLRHPQARVLVQAGIHAGEIDGKDAGLMLLRDIALGKKPALLNNTDWYFVPVLNVDGHERRSGNQRVNQRGPNDMGWRTNAQNLNLNRDYIKAESVEIQAMLRLLGRLDPDLYIDVHVTDGIDYQYDITYGFNDRHAISTRTARWLRTQFQPFVDRGLKKSGHKPGPLIFALNNKDLHQGISDWHASPRYSHGYGDFRHIGSVLIENHSLKPYKQRVLGTYVLLENILDVAGKELTSLREARAGDKTQRQESFGFRHEQDDSAVREIEFAGVSHEFFDSPISGGKEIRWTGLPLATTVKLFPSKPTAFVTRPKAYWLDAGWTHVIDVLKRHGIRYEEIRQTTEKSMEFYRLPDAMITQPSFEGRAMASSGKPIVESRVHTFYPGSIRIGTDQELGALVVALMEPQSEDSLFSWGYFTAILQATEYMEAYVVEPMAAAMLANDPGLKAEFDQALKDDLFANNPEARLRWFYQRSPHVDAHHKLYPVGIER